MGSGRDVTVEVTRPGEPDVGPRCRISPSQEFGEHLLPLWRMPGSRGRQRSKSRGEVIFGVGRDDPVDQPPGLRVLDAELTDPPPNSVDRVPLGLRRTATMPDGKEFRRHRETGILPGWRGPDQRYEVVVDVTGAPPPCRGQPWRPARVRHCESLHEFVITEVVDVLFHQGVCVSGALCRALWTATRAAAT